MYYTTLKCIQLQLSIVDALYYNNFIKIIFYNIIKNSNLGYWNIKIKNIFKYKNKKYI